MFEKSPTSLNASRNAGALLRWGCDGRDGEEEDARLCDGEDVHIFEGMLLMMDWCFSLDTKIMMMLMQQLFMWYAFKLTPARVQPYKI